MFISKKIYKLSNIFLLSEEALHSVRNVIYNSKVYDGHSQLLNSIQDTFIIYHFRKMQRASNCVHNTTAEYYTHFNHSGSLTILLQKYLVIRVKSKVEHGLHWIYMLTACQ